MTTVKLINKRNSLASLVSTGFIIIIVLTVISTILGYERLNNFNKILTSITQNSLPESAQAGQLNSTLKEILYLTERLTNANNLPSRRITIEKLQDQENNLLILINKFGSVVHLNNQLNTARMEIKQLDKLILNRLHNADKIEQLNDKIYAINDEILVRLNHHTPSEEIEKSLMSLIHSSTLRQKAQSSQKLQPVRQLAKEVEDNLNAILANFQTVNTQIAQTMTTDIKKLKPMLLGESGWFSLKIEQLQIAGRVRGRGNFLHNLIVDITILSEAKFYDINKEIIENAQSAANQISQQIVWVISLSVALLIMMCATIYFINNKIVARLLSLNDSVIKRIQSQDVPIDISGKDEISHLAQSFVYFSEKIESQKQQLQTLSLTDVLTNLPNRRSMDERLEHDVNTARRNQWSLSIILLDIDYFKAYNDFYGHIAGDVCLQKVAEGLKNIQQRDSDFIARYGGEEFVMLLPQTDKQGALKVAKRIKELLAILNIPHEKSTVAAHVSVSLGIATFCYNDIPNVFKVLNKADEALYYAKSIGRNTFIHSDDIIDS